MRRGISVPTSDHPSRTTQRSSRLWGMERERHDNWAELVAQSHGLYLRLRERSLSQSQTRPLARHAYARYQRRLAHLSEPIPGL